LISCSKRYRKLDTLDVKGLFKIYNNAKIYGLAGKS